MNGNKESKPFSPENKKAYIDAWASMMVDIWQEKISRLNILDTGAFFASVQELAPFSPDGKFDTAQITHNFLEYGIWQELGVGNGFRYGHTGALDFTPTRQPRPWLSKAYFRSVMALKEKMAEMYGKEFCAMIASSINMDNVRKNSQYYKDKGWA